MSFLLDTNVISESVRPRPDRRVMAWLSNVDEDRVFLSVATVAEIRLGVEALPASARRRQLEAWVEHELPQRFEGRLLPIDLAISHAWGTAIARARRAGITLGAMAGYFGGWIDTIIMRVTDILLAFPGILLAIALVAVLGPSLNNVVLALATIGWVGYARLVRGQVLKVREMEYVTAAKALGARSPRVIVLHVLPNVMNPVIVMATLGLAGAILSEAALSFLGLGVQPPTPSWGAMLTSGRRYLGLANHLAIWPGVAIMLAVMGLNFLGDGLIDALDPKYRKDF